LGDGCIHFGWFSGGYRMVFDHLVNVRKIQAKTNADNTQTENHTLSDSEDSLFSLDRMQVIQTDAGIHILNV